MTDKLLNNAWDSYERECADCKYTFKAPDVHALLCNAMVCGECGQVYEIDPEDVRFLLALLLARVERLERRTSDPFAGLGL